MMAPGFTIRRGHRIWRIVTGTVLELGKRTRPPYSGSAFLLSRATIARTSDIVKSY